MPLPPHAHTHSVLQRIQYTYVYANLEKYLCDKIVCLPESYMVLCAFHLIIIIVSQSCKYSVIAGTLSVSTPCI